MESFLGNSNDLRSFHLHWDLNRLLKNVMNTEIAFLELNAGPV